MHSQDGFLPDRNNLAPNPSDMSDFLIDQTNQCDKTGFFNFSLNNLEPYPAMTNSLAAHDIYGWTDDQIRDYIKSSVELVIQAVESGEELRRLRHRVPDLADRVSPDDSHPMLSYILMQKKLDPSDVAELMLVSTSDYVEYGNLGSKLTSDYSNKIKPVFESVIQQYRDGVSIDPNDQAEPNIA